MCTRGQCQKNLGNWVQFETPWGRHRGVVERVTDRGVLMRVPRQYAPTSLATHRALRAETEEQRLDLALAQWGYGGAGGWGGGAGAPGYGAYGGAYGNRGYGNGGYGGWWGGGWWWWWLAFAWIFWLAFLW
ncbi:MAG: hypothetical protein OWT28_01320 [Firmicutes bacterium]|nr:hypothetical protein [Bacillota bacterium]